MGLSCDSPIWVSLGKGQVCGPAVHPVTTAQSCLHLAHVHQAPTARGALFQAPVMQQHLGRPVPVFRELTVQ